MFSAAIKEARYYARLTKRDPHLIAGWVMEFNTMSTYAGRQVMRRVLVAAVISERKP